MTLALEFLFTPARAYVISFSPIPATLCTPACKGLGQERRLPKYTAIFPSSQVLQTLGWVLYIYKVSGFYKLCPCKVDECQVQL